MTSILLIGFELFAAVCLKLLKNPTIALNLGFIGMSVHALNIIYQSGGVVESTQTYWVPLLVVAFFLSGTRMVAISWSVTVILCSAIMTFMHVSGRSFPVLELSESAQRVEIWSGTVLPLVVICIAQAFTAKQEIKRLRSPSGLKVTVKRLQRKATLGEQNLSHVLEQANQNSIQLKDVSQTLESQSLTLDDQVSNLNINCESQASAAEQMSQQVHQLAEGIEGSTRLSMSSESAVMPFTNKRKPVRSC